MRVIRNVPAEIAPTIVSEVSVSEAEQLLGCPLRVVLNREPSLKELRPFSAAAMLGTATHNALASMTRATRRACQGRTTSTREIARQTFDSALSLLCEKRDADVASRGPLPGESDEAPQDLPFYAMSRARFVRFARGRFGEAWTWHTPEIASGGPNESYLVALAEGTHAEIPLHSSDGVFRAFADSISVSADNTTIEELKTGQLTPERLPGWTLQLVLYGHLYEQKFGTRPTNLRISCVSGACHEIAYDAHAAADEAERVRSSLSRLNARIASGARASDLAVPARDVCSFCNHRPWCSAYWTSPVQECDAEGDVLRIDGWKVVIGRTTGGAFTADFRWYGSLPASGQRIRICNAKVVGDELVLDRNSSVWSLR